MNTTLLDALPFLLLLLIAVGGLAYAAGFSLGRDTGNLEARNAAREERAKLIIRCKREGALAERALWVASSRLDLKPVEFEPRQQVMGCEKCGMNFVYGSTCPHEEDGFHRGKLFYADTGEAVPEKPMTGQAQFCYSDGFEEPATAMDPHCVGNALLGALSEMQDSVRQLAQDSDASYGGGIKVEETK